MFKLNRFRRVWTALFILFVTLSFSASGGKIVFPWRSTTAIAKAGESVEVWFNADGGQTVNSIQLQGPYSSITTTVSTINGSWIYDEWSSNSYNQKVTFMVPPGTPADRYDLVLDTSTGDEISLASVSIITEYRTKFYIFHMSDLHRWQGAFDTLGVILHEQSALVEIANILNPAMVIETGDNIYPNTNVMTGPDVKSTESRINQYINGDATYLGMNDFYAPVFSIPGNHDTPTKNYHTEPGYSTSDLGGPWLAGPALFWNDFFGLQNYNFAYGDARFVSFNNAWCPDTGGGAANYVPNYQWQLDQANDWLQEVGVGTVLISSQHVPQESIPPVYKALENGPSSVIPDIMLAGHIHTAAYNPFIKWDTKVYCTYSPRDGSKKVPFNLFQLDTVAGTVTAVGNSRAAHEGISTREDYSTKKLRLNYMQVNDGTQQSNVATLVNDFGFPIEDARIRFVMAQGADYVLSQGQVMQAFDGETAHVVDVLVDLPANSTSMVSIGVKTSDPNQSQFVSWNVPSEMGLGETVSVDVTMKNSGFDTWTTSGGQQLGSTSSTWGLNRVALPVPSVATNGNAIFSFNITAPATPGAYSFQWQMVDDAGVNTGWFGTQTPAATITVGDTSPVVSFIEPEGDVSLDIGDTLYVNVGATDPNGGSIRVRLYLDGQELSRSEGLAPYEWNAPGQTADPELQNMQTGTYVLTARATDDQNEFSETSITITVGGDDEPVSGGEVVLAVDLHQNSTDPVPVSPDYFNAWNVGNVPASNAAPVTIINGYTVSMGSGVSIACLTTPVLQTGMNARNRSTKFIPNAGDFTQAAMMRERVASDVNPSSSTANVGGGNGLYLKISGLEINTPYLIQIWGVDSTGANPNASLKNGYCYGFNATGEAAGYTSLPLLGSYTVSGSPTTITNNSQYSISGVITTDSSGTLVYKQISNIDRSLMNGFVLSTVVQDHLSGYEIWASENGFSGEPLDDDNTNGWNNLLEYALNGGVSPYLKTDSVPPVFCHLRRNDDADLSYVVEVCTNLMDGVWSTNGVVLLGSSEADGSFDGVTNSLPNSSASVYVRLKVGLTE